MTHYIFKSSTVKDLYGYTEDASGANLDNKRGPWKIFKETQLKPGQKLTGTDSDKALQDIKSAGVHYVIAGVQFNVGIGRQ